MKRILLTITALIAVISASAAQPTSAALSPISAPISAPNASDDTSESIWEFWWGAGCNVATNYMWRGYDQSYRGGDALMFDPSLQPSVTVGYGPFYVDVWTNASLISNYKELDLTLGFEYENLSVTLYDVYCGNFDTPFFDDKNHSLTATVDYLFFDRLNLHWATTFLHSADFLTEGPRAGKRAFASYFEVAYTQPFEDLLDLTVRAGASPWTAPFWCYERDMESVAKGFNVTNLSLTLSREFEYGGVTLPVELGYIYNPTTRYSYAVLKAGFNF